ncbi:MAG: hypothetical protein H0T79_22520 [Deltaproteobacteria bacterium]|nr:hypothetical protein [Deltaproteobacteria bacterium]
MISRHLVRSSVSAFIALFLVFLFPACWAGSLARAAASSLPTSASSNTNEEHQEREEHNEHDEHGDTDLALGARLGQLTSQRSRTVARVPLAAYRSRLIPDRLIPTRHPLQLSTRRLI